MSETEPEDPFWKELGREITEDYKKSLRNLMNSDTLEFNGVTYNFQWVPSSKIKQFKKLNADTTKIQDKDGDDWYNNVKERAIILIEGMTSEKFEQGDYVIIENLVTAWSHRAITGFRQPKSGV